MKPFRKFLAAVDRVAENCVNKNDAGRGPAPYVRVGDARKLPIRNASIDLVLSSPPYLNAIDYIRCSKFSLVWMGYRIPDLRLLRAGSVGSESVKGVLQSDPGVYEIIANLKLSPKLGKRDEAVLARYIDDMRQAMREVARVLTPGGKAVYVVGENTIRGTYVPNSKIIIAVARVCGLNLQQRRVRSLPANRRYLPPPSAGSSSAPMDSRMRREIVLSFVKLKAQSAKNGLRA